MKLSVIIPAHNEEEIIAETFSSLYKKLISENIQHEIIVINDNSTDATENILKSLANSFPGLVHGSTNPTSRGFGNAIRKGLEIMTGDCAAIFMADLSDSPDDLILFFRAMEKGNYDCVFGSRFSKGGSIKNYPILKLILNRITNNLVRMIFGFNYDDCTNAFKLYKRETIEGIKPFLSEHFNLTLELPLKSIIRGYSYTVIPNSWNGRKTGTSSFRIKELGSSYFFILRKCFSEKYFNDKG